MTRKKLGVLRPQPLTRSLTRFLVGALTASVATLGMSSTAGAPTDAVQTASVTNVSRTALAPDTFEKRVQRQVNRRRAAHGLRRLRFSACADGTAERWSSYLAANDLFFHQSMDRVLNKCDARYAGETLGRGSITPRKLVRMWMRSPGHRVVLLKPKARRIGVGATPAGTGRWVVAANFVRF